MTFHIGFSHWLHRTEPMQPNTGIIFLIVPALVMYGIVFIIIISIGGCDGIFVFFSVMRNPRHDRSEFIDRPSQCHCAGRACEHPCIRACACICAI